MPRHAKNNTASPVFTYHERQQLKYGKQKQVLGSESMRNFDCCCLTLQPCREPVVTPNGYLYEKEAIFDCLLAQKKENERKMKLWKQQQAQLEASTHGEGQKQKLEEVEKFEKTELSILPASETNTTSSTTEDDSKKLRAFWAPALTPDASSLSTIEKPSMKTVCPESGAPLKLKHLIPVKFTRAKTTSETDEKKGKYMCPICYEALANVIPMCVLRPTGAVVCRNCVDNFILKDGRDPLSGLTLGKKDIIPLKVSGTGYAAKGGVLAVSEQTPAFRG